jgi:radical SAM-linked protein
MSAPGLERTKVRLRYSKLGKVRFTSHRDTARIWERAIRRAELPVSYTEGFSPHPRLSFGLALSTGHESLGEYLDVDLDLPDAEVDLDAVMARFDPTLPAGSPLPRGFAVQGAMAVEPGTTSLQEAVTSCGWRMEVTGTHPGVVGAAVEQLLDADQLVVTRERKGRDVTEDLRPSLLALAVRGPTPCGTELEAELATQPRALRPGDLLGALAEHLPGATAPLEWGRVCRTHQWSDADGDRREPLPAPPGLADWTFAAPLDASSPTPAPQELRAS